MEARFRAVARWAALILVGIAAGGAGALGGLATETMAVGAVIAFVCGIIVAATSLATYVRASGQSDLVGPGLIRLIGLGFLGMGVVVGALTVTLGVAVAIAAVTGGIVLALTSDAG